MNEETEMALINARFDWNEIENYINDSLRYIEETDGAEQKRLASELEEMMTEIHERTKKFYNKCRQTMDSSKDSEALLDEAGKLIADVIRAEWYNNDLRKSLYIVADKIEKAKEKIHE